MFCVFAFITQTICHCRQSYSSKACDNITNEQLYQNQMHSELRQGNSFIRLFDLAIKAISLNGKTKALSAKAKADTGLTSPTFLYS